MNDNWPLLDRLPAVDFRLAMRDALVMARRSALEVPADLRSRLEAARLDLLALFRALDRIDLAPSEIPLLRRSRRSKGRWRRWL